jgi:hypothetical protein
MNLPNEYHNLLLNELIEVKKLYDNAKSLEDRLYFFSASFGAINRIMNFHYDPLLVFMHQVLQHVHQAMMQRLANRKASGSISNVFPTQLEESLSENFEKLIIEFESKNENSLRERLEKFSNLSYATIFIFTFKFNY